MLYSRVQLDHYQYLSLSWILYLELCLAGCSYVFVRPLVGSPNFLHWPRTDRENKIIPGVSFSDWHPTAYSGKVDLNNWCAETITTLIHHRNKKIILVWTCSCWDAQHAVASCLAINKQCTHVRIRNQSFIFRKAFFVHFLFLSHRQSFSRRVKRTVALHSHL